MHYITSLELKYTGFRMGQEDLLRSWDGYWLYDIDVFRVLVVVWFQQTWHNSHLKCQNYYLVLQKYSTTWKHQNHESNSKFLNSGNKCTNLWSNKALFETCTLVPITILYTLILYCLGLLIPHLPILIKLYKMLFYSSAKRTL